MSCGESKNQTPVYDKEEVLLPPSPHVKLLSFRIQPALFETENVNAIF